MKDRFDAAVGNNLFGLIASHLKFSLQLQVKKSTVVYTKPHHTFREKLYKCMDLYIYTIVIKSDVRTIFASKDNSGSIKQIIGVCYIGKS